MIGGNARIEGSAYVEGNALVEGSAYVGGSARVRGNARVAGDAWVAGDAELLEPRHVLTIGPVGSENQTITLHRTQDGGHLLDVGCWRNHTIDELAAEVQRRAPDRADEYLAIETVLRQRINEWKDAE